MAIAFGFVTAAASDQFLQNESLAAVAMRQVPQNVDDARWNDVPAMQVDLAPQRTIRLNDRTANEWIRRSTIARLSVQAGFSAEQFAVLISWPDDTEDRTNRDEINTYADAIALEVPIHFGPGKRLPHVAMGDVGAPVLVHLLRAEQSESRPSQFVARGFGTLTRTPNEFSGRIAYDVTSKRWRALFLLPLRSLKDSISFGGVPMAFARWDGSHLERGGNKMLSRWKLITLSDQKLNPQWLDELSAGYGGSGNAQKGKTLAHSACIACHQFPGRRIAPLGAAPDLSSIGVIAGYSYLRNSLVNPSEIIVSPLKHPTTATLQPAEALQPLEGKSLTLEWSTIDPEGRHVSKMPSFAALPPEQMADLVAYLKSLDGTVNEGASPP